MAKSFKVPYKIGKKGNAYVPYKGYNGKPNTFEKSIFELDSSDSTGCLILIVLLVLGLLVPFLIGGGICS